MPGELNFFDTYMLLAITEEIVPRQTFFKDRYFPTGEGDIFAADKVLTEYRKGDRKMAAFVSPRAGDIPMDRWGYTIHEYQPAFIAPSRLLTVDDLRKRGFGEALYPGMNFAPPSMAFPCILRHLAFSAVRPLRAQLNSSGYIMILSSFPHPQLLPSVSRGQIRNLHIPGRWFPDSPRWAGQSCGRAS